MNSYRLLTIDDRQPRTRLQRHEESPRVFPCRVQTNIEIDGVARRAVNGERVRANNDVLNACGVE